jgi:hypothetical protein
MLNQAVHTATAAYLLIAKVTYIAFLFFLHLPQLTGTTPHNRVSFPTLDSLLMPYFALVRSELEHGSITWNSVVVTDFL